ncbi:hypothetical protein REPUB_Repub13aG0006900 [Reevesia pubescens]
MSLEGRKFGFCTFCELEDARHAVKMHIGAWLLDFRLGVSLTRFNSRSNYWRKVQPSSNSVPNNQVRNEKW